VGHRNGRADCQRWRVVARLALGGHVSNVRIPAFLLPADEQARVRPAKNAPQVFSVRRQRCHLRWRLPDGRGQSRCSLRRVGLRLLCPGIWRGRAKGAVNPFLVKVPGMAVFPAFSKQCATRRDSRRQSGANPVILIARRGLGPFDERAQPRSGGVAH
jgi:hypothetical protein